MNIETLITERADVLKSANEIKSIDIEKYNELIHRYYHLNNRIFVLNNPEKVKTNRRIYMKKYLEDEGHKNNHKKYSAIVSKRQREEYKTLRAMYRNDAVKAF